MGKRINKMIKKETIKTKEKNINSSPFGKKFLLIFVVTIVILLLVAVGLGFYFHFTGKIQIPVYVLGISSSIICTSIFGSFYIILRSYFKTNVSP